jgi:hypothetical protein
MFVIPWAIIAAIAAVVAAVASLGGVFLLLNVVKSLLLLFGISVSAVLLFTLFALFKKFIMNRKVIPEPETP